MRHIFVQWVLIALLALAVAFAVYRIQNVQHHQNDALHSIICRAETFIKANKNGSTFEQRRRALHFYEQALKGAHLPPCP